MRGGVCFSGAGSYVDMIFRSFITHIGCIPKWEVFLLRRLDVPGTGLFG